MDDGGRTLNGSTRDADVPRRLTCANCGTTLFLKRMGGTPDGQGRVSCPLGQPDRCRAAQIHREEKRRKESEARRRAELREKRAEQRRRQEAAAVEDPPPPAVVAAETAPVPDDVFEIGDADSGTGGEPDLGLGDFELTNSVVDEDPFGDLETVAAE